MAVRKQKADDETPGAANNVIEAPMTPRRVTVSESLRGRRIECGLDIDYVAQILRIRPAVLTAIEKGEFDQLPGPAYAVGFVRSYATYLGLDAEALVVRFKNETAAIARRPHLEFPLPIRDSRVPTGPLLIICILLAIITYGGWYYMSAKPDQLAGMVPTVPERLQHLLSMPAPKNEAAAPDSVAPAQAQPVAAQAPTATADAGTSQSSPVAANPALPAAAPPAAPTSGLAPASTGAPTVDGVPPVENRSSTAAAAPSLPASPDLAQPPIASDTGSKPAGDAAYGAPDGQARVVLRATADSWVQVRDKGSNLLFTRVLKPGEHYNVPNQAGLTLIAGNAGGIDITVDGVNAPSIGEAGRVARNVSLDPDHLLAAQSHAN
jgi:cytoskeleton protein RodZ